MLHVHGVEWRFTIESVTRVGRELFIRIALDGPEACVLTVQLHDRVVFGVTASEILNAACEWLRARGTTRQGFIDLADGRDGWGSVAVA
jgi:hypothetical protein